MRKPKKKDGPKQAARTKRPPPDMGGEAQRAKAYFDMEPYVCDLARAAEIAMILHDDDTGLLLFAVDQFNKLAEDLRQRWYTMEFPPN
jgi:hypothetical protein